MTAAMTDLTSTIARLRELEAKAEEKWSKDNPPMEVGVPWPEVEYLRALRNALPVLLDAAEGAENGGDLNEWEQACDYWSAEAHSMAVERDRLAARVAALEDGLRPFGELGERLHAVEAEGVPYGDDHHPTWLVPTVGDLRRARALLEPKS